MVTLQKSEGPEAWDLYHHGKFKKRYVSRAAVRAASDRLDAEYGAACTTAKPVWPENAVAA